MRRSINSMTRVHTIRRQVFEITVSDPVLVTNAQTMIRDCYERDIVPLLDREFSALAGPDEVVRLERLELDLGTITPEELERELLNRTKTVLRRELQLQPAPKRHSSDAESGTDDGRPTAGKGRDGSVQQGTGKNKHILPLLESFLETGLLPWWASDVTLESMGQALKSLPTSDHPALVKLLHKAVKRVTPLYRLIQQSSDDVLLFLGELLAGLRQLIIFDVITEAAQILEALPSRPSRIEARTGSWHAFFVSLSDSTKRELSQQILVRQMAQTLSSSLGRELLYCDGKDRDKLQQVKTNLYEEMIRVSRQEARVEQKSGHRSPRPSARDRNREHTHDLPAVSKKVKDSCSSNSISTQKGDLDTASPTSDFSIRQNTEIFERPGINFTGASRSEQSCIGSALRDISEEGRKIARMIQEEGIAVNNCGLVILWPYLGRFFSACGILANGAFPDDRATAQGVHLLNLLSAGTDSAEEHLLALNKILCGRALEEPVDRETILSRSERAEAENLLKTAIGHWTALRQTSVHAFRSSFLLRSGILSRKESGWLLQVERKPYDVLLERLPWSISIIKLSWMKQPLHVEW